MHWKILTCTNVRTYYLSKYSNMRKELLIWLNCIFTCSKFDKRKVVLVVPQCTNMTCGDAGEFGKA